MADDELQRCIERPTPGIELTGTVLEHALDCKHTTARSAQARPLLNDNTLLSSADAPTLELARPARIAFALPARTPDSMTEAWGITFDMSGGRKHAQRAFGCPLDGGVIHREPDSIGQCRTVKPA